ncbi:hypothetical protein ACFVUS_12430 [Nocardia sp. NPDC058058]|uniref:hypothetical protein n=1 Tax=Nocardia sp. NPDC058058 TaxID=3346317 RepID=UPI0036D9E0BA
MEEVKYVPLMEPRRFRLGRSDKTIVETQLIGLWKVYETDPEKFRRGDNLVGWKVRLDNGREVSVAELMYEWGETTLSTPDINGAD